MNVMPVYVETGERRDPIDDIEMKDETPRTDLATPQRFVDALVSSGRVLELADVDDLSDS
jgi:hypothetical protein